MKIIISILCIFIRTACFAQSTATASLSLTLPDIASIAIAPDNSTINLTGTVSPQAGSSIIFASNTTKWINFTSAVASDVTRKITAQITSGSIPSGMTLKLTISPVSGAGAGTRGTNVSTINLSSSAQDIITGIRGSYTGQGSLNGYNLTYELVITDYSLLRSGTTNLSITFTIT